MIEPSRNCAIHFYTTPLQVSGLVLIFSCSFPVVHHSPKLQSSGYPWFAVNVAVSFVGVLADFLAVNPNAACAILMMVSSALILLSVSICIDVFSYLYLSKTPCTLPWISSLSKSFDLLMKHLLGLFLGLLLTLYYMKWIIYFMTRSLLLLLILVPNWWKGGPRHRISTSYCF